MLLDELELQIKRLKTHRAFVYDIEPLLPIDKQRHLERGMDLLIDVINRLEREYCYMEGQIRVYKEQTHPQDEA